MKLQELLSWRYATKSFDVERKISAEDLQKLKALLRFSPSSVNLQPWHFIISGSDQAKAKVLQGLDGFNAYNQSKVKEASQTIVCCVKTEVSEDYMQQILEAEEKAGRFPNEEAKERVGLVRNNFANLHRNHGDFNSWLEKQVFLNMGHFVLGAASLGIDSLIMEGADFNAIDEAFSLSEKGLRSIALISIGYRSEDDTNNPEHSPKARLELNQILTEL